MTKQRKRTRRDAKTVGAFAHLGGGDLPRDYRRRWQRRGPLTSAAEFARALGRELEAQVLLPLVIDMFTQLFVEQIETPAPGRTNAPQRRKRPAARTVGRRKEYA